MVDDDIRKTQDAWVLVGTISALILFVCFAIAFPTLFRLSLFGGSILQNPTMGDYLWCWCWIITFSYFLSTLYFGGFFWMIPRNYSLSGLIRLTLVLAMLVAATSPFIRHVLRELTVELQQSQPFLENESSD